MAELKLLLSLESPTGIFCFKIVFYDMQSGLLCTTDFRALPHLP